MHRLGKRERGQRGIFERLGSHQQGKERHREGEGTGERRKCPELKRQELEERQEAGRTKVRKWAERTSKSFDILPPRN